VDAILMATAHILQTEGFDKASTNRVAKLAGVSIGSVYQYFPNRDAMVATLRRRHQEWFRECLHAEFARIAAQPLREALRRLVDLLIDLHVINPELHNTLNTHEADSESHHGDPEGEHRIRELAVRYLEAHRDEVRPKDLDLSVFLCTEVLETLVHGIARRCPERLQDPAFRDELTELLVRYLAR
jgi:AcrR family transcriptional regulator